MTSWHWLIPFFIVGGGVALFLWLVARAGFITDAIDRADDEAQR